MYTATMRYVFNEDSFEEGCQIWNDTVMPAAKNAQGLIRMQFLTGNSMGLALGTWETKKHAEAFMQTGIFIKLKEKLKGKLKEEPQPEQWTLAFYQEGE